jgi:hypothetical protein
MQARRPRGRITIPNRSLDFAAPAGIMARAEQNGNGDYDYEQDYDYDAAMPPRVIAAADT